MSTNGDEELVERVARQGQIIVGVLIAGVISFFGIVTILNVTLVPSAQAAGNPAELAAGPAAPNPSLTPGQLLTWVSLAFAAVSLPLSFLVPGVIVRQNRQAIAMGKWTPPPTRQGSIRPPVSPEAMQTDAGKLAMVYLTQLIIGEALIEGAAFLAGVAYLIGKDPIALGLGLFLLGVLITRFPTTHRVALWIDR
jgi:hypothetical protein